MITSSKIGFQQPSDLLHTIDLVNDIKKLGNAENMYLLPSSIYFVIKEEDLNLEAEITRIYAEWKFKYKIYLEFHILLMSDAQFLPKIEYLQNKALDLFS